MTYAEWIESLDWREGKPPGSYGDWDVPIPFAVKDGGGTAYVVGGLNELGGVCDCCLQFDLDKATAWAPIAPCEKG